jgi:hypothetical protein
VCRLTGYSLLVTTSNYNTLKITVTITLQLFSCLLDSLRLTASQLRLNVSHIIQLVHKLLSVLSLSVMLRPTVQSTSLSWNKAPIWDLRPDFCYCQTVAVAGLFMWGALSDERTSLSFTIAAGPRQSSHSRVRVPWDWRPYFTVSNSRLPVSSPPTTRRATVEVFDSASTRETCLF